MYIKSAFKDYYDFVHGYNAEDDYPIYNRYTSVENFKKPGSTVETEWYMLNKDVLEPLLQGTVPKYRGNFTPRSGVLSFCGKLYPSYLVDGLRLYSCEDLAAFKPSLIDHPDSMLTGTLTDRTWKMYITQLNGIDTVPVHIALNSPVIYYGHTDNSASPRVIIINPSLSDLQFYTQVTPELAYQSIDNFLSNYLHQIPSQVAEGTTDKLKAESHGFDKLSFRKQPVEK